MTESIHDIVSAYVDLWNEADGVRRRAAARAVLTEDSSYTDPDWAVEGPDAIDRVIGQAREKFGELVFSVGEVISAHHDTALFTWRLAPPDGSSPVARGYDVAIFSDGRIRGVTGLFEQV